MPQVGLATLFAPYDPTAGLDLTLIRTVVDARKADARAHYAEGENPFTIRYAVYNLDNPVIVTALADAEDGNVDVQILIESDQLDPGRNWNTTDEELGARGFEIVPDHGQLDDAGRTSADLIGMKGQGLFHLKARLFRWIDPATGQAEARLATGSQNAGDLATHNEENLHYITLPEVIERYQAKYDAVLHGSTIQNQWTEGAPVNVLFSPDRGPQAIDHLARLIDEEDELILVAVFALRNARPTTGGKGILDRLVAARKRGVFVAVVTDRKMADGVKEDGSPEYADNPAEEILRQGGVPVYEVMNHYSPYNAMHHKYGVFGLSRPIVVTDAGNWSRASLGSYKSRPENDESVLFIDAMALDGGATARRYLGNWLDLVRRYGTQGTDGHSPTEGPEPAGLYAELAALPGWPRAEIAWRARVDTRYGEGVYVTGEPPELGAWTQSGDGWPLGWVADGTWESAPVALPFGAVFEYKLIKREGAQVAWEGGANRRLVADPTDRRVVPWGKAAVDVSWR